MNLESWAEHHQLLLWSVALVVAVVLGMKESVRAIAGAAPRGIKAIRVARLRLLIRTLEDYRREKSILVIEIFRELTTVGLAIFFATETMVLRYGYSSWRPPYLKSELSDSPQHLTVNIYIMSCGILAGVALASLDCMLVLWKYRTPGTRLPILRRKLADLSPELPEAPG